MQAGRWGRLIIMCVLNAFNVLLSVGSSQRLVVLLSCRLFIGEASGGAHLFLGCTCGLVLQ